MKIITFNILAQCMVEYFRNIHHPSFTREQRSPVILKTLLDEDADVVCLQEVDPEMFCYLDTHLEGFTSHFVLNPCGRFGCAAFVKGACDFGEIDFKDGSRRKAQLIYRDDGLIVNNHFDFGKGVTQMKDILMRDPDVICGDFNAGVTSDVMKLAMDAGFVCNESDEWSRVNDYGEMSLIDFIVTKRGIETKVCYEASLKGPSDHAPVVGNI